MQRSTFTTTAIGTIGALALTTTMAIAGTGFCGASSFITVNDEMAQLGGETWVDSEDGAMTVAVLDEMRPSSEVGDDMGLLTMATDLPLTISGVIGQTRSWFTVAMTELPVPDGPQNRMMDLAALTSGNLDAATWTAYGSDATA